VGVALLFNGAGVVAAISGLVSPIWAMVAMGVSVSLVLANSFGGRLLSTPEVDGAAARSNEYDDSKFRTAGT
jgi:hypothetical protein